MRSFIVILLLTLMFPALPVLAEEPTDRPNILLITADDMNWDSLGCFGNDLKGITPNLDRLASQGVRFEHAYVTIAICQPCRASLMTGRYPHGSGALGFDKINSGVPTLPETMRKQGYYTAAIGKAVHTIPSRHKTAFDETYDMHQLGYGRSALRYCETTTGAIAKAKANRKPFFLNVNLHDPHRPFANSAQEKREKKPELWEGLPLVEHPYQPDEVPLPGFLPDLPMVRLEMAEYFTSVRRCDQIIGDVLKVLDESGQTESTIVIFLSDHGIAVPFAKTNCWMHSNRTPMIIRWPGKTPKGESIGEKMVSSIDIAPTILDIAGLGNLDGADGKSFRGLIDPRVSSEAVGRDHIFVHLNYPFSRKPVAMRGVITINDGYIWNGWSDGKTKFSNESMSGRTFAAMTEAAKQDPAVAKRVGHYLYRCPEEYYDYKSDPDALVNQIDRPNSHSKIVATRSKLLLHMQQSDDPQLENYKAHLNAKATNSHLHEIVEIELADKERLKGRLSLPHSETESPVETLFIFVHGTGPGTYLTKRKRGDTTFNYFDYYAEEFNDLGIAFFSYNKRGVTNGDTPPYFDKVDREKFRRAIPSVEVSDLGVIIDSIKRNKRLADCNIVLLGHSEGTMIAAMAAKAFPDKVDALFLGGYAHENMYDIIAWQNSGHASMLKINPIFDADKDGKISKPEYESDDKRVANFRKGAMQGAGFAVLDFSKDGLLTAEDFGARQQVMHKMLLYNIAKENEDWIWKNYFRVSIPWLQEHFSLEPNKTRLTRLDLPIYIFHGSDDAHVPAEGVRDLERRFTTLGKTNLQTFIFKDHGHNLNFGEWVLNDEKPAAYTKLFEVAKQLDKPK